MVEAKKMKERGEKEERGKEEERGKKTMKKVFLFFCSP